MPLILKKSGECIIIVLSVSLYVQNFNLGQDFSFECYKAIIATFELGLSWEHCLINTLCLLNNYSLVWYSFLIDIYIQHVIRSIWHWLKILPSEYFDASFSGRFCFTLSAISSKRSITAFSVTSSVGWNHWPNKVAPAEFVRKFWKLTSKYTEIKSFKHTY